MSYIRDRVFVLHREAYREHDRRYTMFGRECGLMRAIARGASSMKSKQAGHLEPFTEAEVMVARGRTYDTLAVARGVSAPQMQVLTRSLSSLAVLGAFSYDVMQFHRPGMVDVRVYDLLIDVRDALAGLQMEPSKERAHALLAGARVKLLDIFGIGPDLDSLHDIDPQTRTLLKFLRRFPCTDVLRVTAPGAVFLQAAAYIEDAMKHAPLEQPLPGNANIHSLLGFVGVSSIDQRRVF